MFSYKGGPPSRKFSNGDIEKENAHVFSLEMRDILGGLYSV